MDFFPHQFDVCKHFTQGGITARNSLLSSLCYQGKKKPFLDHHLSIFCLRFLRYKVEFKFEKNSTQATPTSGLYDAGREENLRPLGKKFCLPGDIQTTS